jgi:RNA polymerase-binding transcription factor DksA
MTIDTHIFKEKLEAEKIKLEKELGTVGEKNPSNPEDWEGKEPDFDTDTADEEELADAKEGFETNSAIVGQLEIRLLEVTTALGKIEAETFGICNVCGEHIEEDRLNANPAATTCKKHMS